MKSNLSNKDQKNKPLSAAELRSVRAAAIVAGTSLQRWSREQGWQFGNAHSALTGRRNGPKANALRAKVRETFVG